jgi:DNA-binding transcriptional MocR family regulator
MHILVRFYARGFAKDFAKRVVRQGVGLQNAKPYYLRAKHTNEFLLGYATLSNDAIREGVRRISRAM